MVYKLGFTSRTTYINSTKAIEAAKEIGLEEHGLCHIEES